MTITSHRSSNCDTAKATKEPSPYGRSGTTEKDRRVDRRGYTSRTSIETLPVSEG